MKVKLKLLPFSKR